MTNVLFRADASPAIGTGHVMRCLAVAEAVQGLAGQAHIASAAITPPLENRLVAAGITVHRLTAPPGSLQDLETTQALAKALNVRAVVVDGYHFDAAWRAGLRMAGYRILAFDDLAVLDRLHADIIVNAAPQADRLPYARIAPGATLLLGPAYMPLRREIREARRACRPPVELRDVILLTFGGADPLGLTAPCLRRLAPRLPSGCRLVAVVGGSDPRAGQILAEAQALAADEERVEVHHDSSRMGILMASAGLAVAAGGGTIGELAALGVPTLLVIVADNQAPTAAEAAAAGWCRVIDARDTAPEATVGRITDAALALWSDSATRMAMAARAATLLDGEGAARIAQALCAR